MKTGRGTSRGRVGGRVGDWKGDGVRAIFGKSPIIIVPIIMAHCQHDALGIRHVV